MGNLFGKIETGIKPSTIRRNSDCDLQNIVLQSPESEIVSNHDVEHTNTNSSRKINSRAESDSDCNNRFQQSATSIQHTEPENVSNHEPSNEITHSDQNVGDEHLNDNLLVSNVDSVQQRSGPESIQPTLPEIMSNNEPSIEMTNSKVWIS